MRVEKGTGSVNCATGHHHQLSTPSQLRNEDILRFVIYITQVQSDEVICKPCKDDVTQVDEGKYDWQGQGQVLHTPVQ